MKRSLFICLLCVLPLQSSLAVAMEYCGHEPAETQASHPGHHEHEHQKASESSPDPLPQVDVDCAHHCFPVLVPSFAMTSNFDFYRSYCPDQPSDFKSAVLDPTERPPLPARA